MNAQQIPAEVAQYAPAVIATMIAVEQSAHQLPGRTKAQIVCDAVLAGTEQLAGVPNQKAAGIFQMINMFTGIFNAAKLFNHGASPNSTGPKLAAQSETTPILDKQ